MLKMHVFLDPQRNDLETTCEASSLDDSKNFKRDAGISIWIYAYGIPADTPLLGGFPPVKEPT